MKETAQLLYDAYIASSGGLNYEGKPCPAWAELPEAIRTHWRAVVREADRIYGISAAGIEPS